MFLLSCFCLYICLFLPDRLSFSFPFFLCDPFFLFTFIHVSLSWLLSLFVFFLQLLLSTHPPISLFSSFLSALSLSSSSGERCLTRSPWSSRVQWRESWVWWTTCPALSATTTRCPPGPASTAPTRRSIITRMITHFLHFIRPLALIPLQRVGLEMKTAMQKLLLSYLIIQHFSLHKAEYNHKRCF